jgi:hypothetical protein
MSLSEALGDESRCDIGPRDSRRWQRCGGRRGKATAVLAEAWLVGDTHGMEVVSAQRSENTLEGVTPTVVYGNCGNAEGACFKRWLLGWALCRR